MTPDHLIPDFARNMRILGHSDQGGRADGIQIMVSGGYAYVGHVFNNGFSVMDVRDPKNPKFVRHVPQPEGTWSQHLQTHGDILIVNNMCDMLKVETSGAFDPGEYYKGSVADKIDITSGEKPYSAGMRGAWRPPDVLGWRRLGLYLGPAAGFQRRHFHDRGFPQPPETACGQPALERGHAHGRW